MLFKPTRKSLRRFKSKLRLARRERANHRHITRPVLVYQSGKVASTTLTRTFEAIPKLGPVEHVHGLTQAFWLDMLESTLDDEAGNKYAGHCKRQIGKAAQLRQLITADQDSAKRWTVVTAFRDPVARLLSAAFHLMEVSDPRILSQDRTAREAAVDSLRSCLDFVIRNDLHGQESRRHDFLSRAIAKNLRMPHEWFDRELKPVFGIDVFATSFDHDANFQVLSNANARVLVLRVEGLDRTLKSAVSAFLGHHSAVPRKHSNAVETKIYAREYDRFMASVQLPEKFLSDQYATRCCQHFYTTAERRALFERWNTRNGTVPLRRNGTKCHGGRTVHAVPALN